MRNIQRQHISNDIKRPALFHTVQELRDWVKARRAEGLSIGFVPTMGALHEGHLSLVEIARQEADIVVSSIFVNPTQFAPNEDFDTYPRTLDSDTDKLATVGCDAIFAPSVDEMYPEGFATGIHIDAPIIHDMEGAARPGFFDGVAIIVSKLLLQVLADVAVFGEKDYQQLQMVKHMVRDLNIPTQIVGGPIIRDENGLALSSRNAYLDEAQYKTAIKLNNILFTLSKTLRSGEHINSAMDQARADILEAGFDSIDYLELRDASTLEHVDIQNLTPQQHGTLRLLSTVRVGGIRLLDNVPV